MARGQRTELRSIDFGKSHAIVVRDRVIVYLAWADGGMEPEVSIDNSAIDAGGPYPSQNAWLRKVMDLALTARGIPTE